ncbi:MAG: DNA polymerase Y family protein [Beijerinckiaceae bacterium]|nr:DNA polymerase Y family protein [Beijerinckiaceae bacterium]
MPRYLSVFLSAWTAQAPTAGPRETLEADREKRLGLIADWCRRFTPLAAADAPDGIVLDVAGAAHLFGGEAALAAQVEEKLARHGARTGLADTPEAAWALARYGADAARERILPAGDAKALARAMANLPVAALRIELETARALSQTGLKCIGDIVHRPRAPIVARFGAQVFARLDAMMGLAKRPISPRFEAPAYVAERRFAEGIAAREQIESTIASLARDLCDMLARHDEGARSLAVILFRVDGAVRRIDCAASRPLREPSAIARLFREKIEALSRDEGGLDVGYGFDLLRLAVMQAEKFAPGQSGFKLSDLAGPRSANDSRGFHRVARADDALADFLDRMSARFGAHRVLRFWPQDSHMPEAAALAMPASRGAPPQPPPAPEGRGLRPLRLFEKPEPIETIAEVPDGPPLRFRWRRAMHEVVAIEGPERIAPQWWKNAAPALTRDYFRVEDSNGRRFWLYREGLYGAQGALQVNGPRWFVQGLFA